MLENQDLSLAIGRIEGAIDGIKKTQDNHTEMLSGVDQRLRNVEQKAAVHSGTVGGLAGLVVASGVSVIRARLGV
ncbi:MAG: hypothetical protein HQL52_03845 [Magnetococcales bacterium]|nr:hypothetical protein [Magnetococcales bacterium]